MAHNHYNNNNIYNNNKLSNYINFPIRNFYFPVPYSIIRVQFSNEAE